MPWDDAPSTVMVRGVGGVQRETSRTKNEASGMQNSSQSHHWSWGCCNLLQSLQSSQSGSNASSHCFRLNSGNPRCSLLKTIYPDMSKEKSMMGGGTWQLSTPQSLYLLFIFLFVCLFFSNPQIDFSFVGARRMSCGSFPWTQKRKHNGRK